MSAPYTHKNLADVEDAAVKFGFGDTHESRFANEDLETEQTGLSVHRVKPGKRQPFAHRHDDVEEVYVVLSGSGRVKLDEDIVELKRLDAVRVSPGVARAFEGGEDGLELLAFSPRRTDDRGEILQDWWTD
ncbi:MAG TPA: cupin domain-containing protein [Gaiellaceae bacterium]|nr:cupin domain-containing protein [Gaiellaceae bacterium]